MPAWLAGARTDEVWQLVVFLRALPAMSPRTFRQLALGSVRFGHGPG